MDIRHIVRAGAVVMVAALLLTFAFAAAPGGVKAAFAQESAKAAAPAEGEVKAEDEAKAAEGAAAEGEVKAEAAEGEGEEAEIPHKVGNPTPAQKQDLRNAWAGIPGYDLLIVAILGLVATVGVVGFGAFKQSRV